MLLLILMSRIEATIGMSLDKVATSDRVAKATTAAAIAAEGDRSACDHHCRVKATNPLEQLEAEIKRCANVVGIFRKPPSVSSARSCTAHNDEWRAPVIEHPNPGLDEQIVFHVDINRAFAIIVNGLAVGKRR